METMSLCIGTNCGKTYYMFSEHILTNHDSLCLKFALIVENYPIFIVISGYTVSHTHTYSVIHSPYNFGWLLLSPPLLVASPG